MPKWKRPAAAGQSKLGGGRKRIPFDPDSADFFTADDTDACDDLDFESELSAKSTVNNSHPVGKNSATSKIFPGYPLTTCALVALTN
jgi:hypothetical protein